MSIKDYARPISLKGKLNTGILLIHGFTGCNVSMKYLSEKLNKQGFAIESPCLAGHGTTWEDLDRVSHNDWFIDVENALNDLKKRCKTVFVAGLSMGGLLAMYLAQKYPDIAGIVLINHALFFNDRRFNLVPYIKNFVKTTAGTGNDIKDKTQDEKPYDTVPSQGAYELYKLVQLIKSVHHKVKQPVLIFKSIEDHVISFKSAEYTYDKIASTDKEIIWLKNSYHVATMDYDKDIIVQKTLEFIKRLGQTKAPAAAKKIASKPKAAVKSKSKTSNAKKTVSKAAAKPKTAKQTKKAPGVKTAVKKNTAKSKSKPKAVKKSKPAAKKIQKKKK